MIRVFITHPSLGRAVPVSAHHMDTLDEVKRKVSNQLGLPTDSFVMVHMDQVPPPHTTLNQLVPEPTKGHDVVIELRIVLSVRSGIC
jgi:hypothetical protein